VPEAVPLRDPQCNGIAPGRDHAPRDWPRVAQAALALHDAPPDVAALLAEGRDTTA